MNTLQDVKDFVSRKTLALAGVSRNEKAFSHMAFRELRQRGYRLFPVNPNARSIDGETCYASLAALPEKPEGVLILTSPAETEKVVREAAAAGIRRIWIQQGAESKAALAFCAENGLPAVSKQCIMMFAEPVGSFHAFHRWVAKLFGKLPK